ncbi:MAG: insulinase family protein [Cyclobacteriaceae bacterium]|jgi:zinc protease|nr:insulinase family protein [Cyclobacteriaceae bacterium]
MKVASNKKMYWLIACLALAQVVWAQGPLADPLPVDPNVKVGKLSNGLTYYIRKNTKPEKKVELRLVVNAGSILEDDDQQGLAHFVEHMAFNGTKNFKKNDLVSYLQSIGVKFGNDLNAYTSFDETVYILPIPTENKENVEKGFQVLEDWASTIAFEHEEIDKERGVILEESRLGKGAQDRMQKQYLPKILAGSKYAERLPIGKDDIIQNFKYDVIKRFYRDWYRPNQMAVAVVGDLEPAEAEALVKKHFEKLKNPGKERKRADALVPPRTKSEGLVVTDKENPNSIVQVFYSPKKAAVQTTLKDYRESIVQSLFTQMLSGRLQELTQKPEPPFVFGGSNLGGFVRGYESFFCFALIGKSGPEGAITALVTENERARKFGFTQSELDRTKKTLMKGIERSYNERDKTESEQLVNEYVRNFLQKEPIPGIENEYNYYKQFLDGITLDEVNKFAAANIPSAESKLIVLLAPEKPDYELPTNEKLLAYADAATKQEIKPYEEKAVAASLMEELPAAGRIGFQKENKEAGFYELTLSNGVKVLLKPTDYKNDQVVLSGFRFGGQYNYDTKDRFNAENAATLVSQMGVGKFSPNDLRKTLAGKTVSASPRISATTEGINGSSSAEDVETLLQLVHLYFTQPRKDEELYKSFVSKQQAMVQNMLSDPQMVFQDSLLRTVYKNHPRAPRVPRAEDYNQVNVDRALEIYRERFSNANGFTFVIIGAFQLDKIKPLIANYLASLPSDKTKTSTYKDIGLRPVRGVVKKEVKKGTEAKSFIAMQFTGEAAYSAAEQLKLQALIETINIKLIETLREKMSGTYTGGMSGSLSKYPYEGYTVNGFIPCGPENVDKLIAATLEELDKVRKNGPTAADLAKVKENWKKQYQENLKDNNYWMRQLQSSVENGLNPADILTYESRVDAITVADLKAAANKYLDMKNYIQVVLNPEK